MGLTSYKMSQEMGYPKPHGYTQFENSKKAVNIGKLVKLWKISKLSADDFMQMLESEIIETNKESKK